VIPKIKFFTPHSILLHNFFTTLRYSIGSSSGNKLPKRISKMKKILLLVVVAVISVAALGFAGLAYAQSQNPTTPFGPGMMGGWGGQGMMGRGSGMMGGPGMMNGYGWMHEYMVSAFSEAIGLAPEEVQSRLQAGETMWQIAEAQGFTDDEIAGLMLEAREAALARAVAEGVITQEQADLMLERMNQMHANGYGPGSCHGAGRDGNGRGSGWRSNNWPQY
jgi:hypothetical protein